MNTEELFWKAVTENDGRFDGVFYTGVLTTGIYCRPSCRARLPKRQNVRFFARIEEAEAAGLRACLRCKLSVSDMVDPKIDLVVNICRHIETDQNADLKALSDLTGKSAGYLQRTFKEIAGVSPKRFLEYQRIGEFRGNIKKGVPIADAIYSAGYESSSRLYESVTGKLGMTPSEYGKGGIGMRINYAIADSGLGKLLLAATEKGICSLKLGDRVEDLENELRTEFSNAEISEDRELLAHYLDEASKACEGKPATDDLPFDIRATSFQMRVWEALRKIPFGKTITYAELARNIGEPKAVRAVANACGQNRIAVLIPCHRVVGSDGKLRGYRWGTERKAKLLDFEASAGPE